MKAIYSIILISFTIFTFGQSNDYNYFIFNVSKIENESVSMSSKYSDLIETNPSDIQYEMKLIDDEALLIPIEKLDNSQIYKYNLNTAFINSQGKFYYNNKTKTIENKKIHANKSYIVESTYNNYDWKIDNTIVNVLGRDCKKAVYERTELGLKGDKKYTITVWFDENFGKNIAPFGLVGLPGLIVKVNFNNGYMVKLNKMGIKPNLKIKKFKKGKRISVDDYQKLIDEFILKLRERRKSNSIDW